MATSGKFLGTQVSAYIGNKKLFNARSMDFSLDTDMIDVSDNESSFKAFLAGDHTSKFNIEGNLEQQASVTTSYVSFEDLLDYQINRTLIAFYLATGTVGDLKLIANGRISNTQMTAPHGDVVTFTAAIQLTGTITIASQS